MEFQELEISGTYRIALKHFKDARGSFVKTFNADLFAGSKLNREFKEQFYSKSVKGVLRGMHFQLPPSAHDKLVVCIEGEILDVILDLRAKSPTFGRAISVKLSGEEPAAVFIPIGCAHGFYTLSSTATMHYSTTIGHDPSSDTGIRWDSFGFAWPDKTPVTSDRDAKFVALQDFKTPF